MSIARKVSDVLSLAMIGAHVAFLVATWNAIPSVVPSHFDVFGMPDAYGDKSVLLLEPAVALGMWALLAVARRRPQWWNFPVRVTQGNRAALYAIGDQMMVVLTPLTVFLLVYVGLMGVVQLPAAALYLALGGVIAVVAVGIVRMVRVRGL